MAHARIHRTNKKASRLGGLYYTKVRDRLHQRSPNHNWPCANGQGNRGNDDRLRARQFTVHVDPSSMLVSGSILPYSEGRGQGSQHAASHNNGLGDQQIDRLPPTRSIRSRLHALWSCPRCAASSRSGVEHALSDRPARPRERVPRPCLRLWRDKDEVDRGLDRAVTDLLVDMIRGRVRQVGVEGAVGIALVER